MSDSTTLLRQRSTAHCAHCPAFLTQQHDADPGCAFCAIVSGAGPARIVRRWKNVIAFRPREGGVVDGHILVVPHAHVADAGVDPTVSALTMAAAAELAGELDAFNIITSKGKAGTQSVFHLHIHVVPRAMGDGLLLPWSPMPTLRITVQHDPANWNVNLLLDRCAA